MPSLTLTFPTDLLARPLPETQIDLPLFALTPDFTTGDAIQALAEHMDRLAVEQLFLRIDRLLLEQPVSAIKLNYHWVVESKDTEAEEVFPVAKVSLRWAVEEVDKWFTNETVEKWLIEAMGMEPGAMGGGRAQVMRDLRQRSWIETSTWHDTSRQLYTERFGSTLSGAWHAALERESLHKTLEQAIDPDLPAAPLSRVRL